jgi:hypothetical protein
MSAVNGQHRTPAWITGALAPFLAVRCGLVAIAWFAHRLPLLRTFEAQHLPLGPGWERPYLFTPAWLLDVWGRWDAVWYVDIALNGYRVTAPLASAQQNVAFYPLYPLAMRAVALLFPASVAPPVAALAAGVLLSNAAALGAVLLLHRHVQRRFGDAAARRTVWALLAFPTSFFLSCAYTEAFFLLLAITCFDAAWNERWPLAGLAGGLLALCRANGVVAIAPLVVLALRGARWRPWRATAGALAWASLVLVGFFVWWAWLWHLTGSPAAVGQAAAAWNRGFVMPWVTLLDFHSYPLLDPDRLALLLMGVLAVLSFFRLSIADGVFAAAIMTPALCSAVLTSGARYVSVVFPAFVLVGTSSRHRLPWRLAFVACLAIQGLLFANWCRGQFID